MRKDEERTSHLGLRCLRWGLYDVGELEVRSPHAAPHRRLGADDRSSSTLKAYPRAEELQRILAPRETQVFTGSEVARTKGDGVEYADLREYVSR